MIQLAEATEHLPRRWSYEPNPGWPDEFVKKLPKMWQNQLFAKIIIKLVPQKKVAQNRLNACNFQNTSQSK
jgi:hypothetical protein